MADKSAAWTVLLYLNADANGLEDSALATFEELARIGSTPSLHIVAQIDLRADPLNRDRWPGARRFHITRDLPAVTASALPDFGGIVNSGDGEVLADFVRWGRTTFPAARTMLIISGHGRGYSEMRGRRAHLRHLLTPTVTTDGTAEDSLYVTELQDALASCLGDDRLDIIGFDSCLMGMVEVAYSMRDVARVMVASEEIETPSGWTYEWLRQLEDEDPQLEPERVARIIVDAHRPDANGDCPVDTLAAYRLDAMDNVAERIDAFACTAFASGGADAWNNIAFVRSGCRTFAGRASLAFYYGIDCLTFLESVHKSEAPSQVRTAASEAARSIKRLIIAHTASPALAAPGFSAQGIAIYFPPSHMDMAGDPFVSLYTGSSATGNNVRFSQDHRWLDFLRWALPLEPVPRRSLPEGPRMNFMNHAKGDQKMEFPLDELLSHSPAATHSRGVRSRRGPAFSAARPIDPASLAPHPTVLKPWPDIAKYLDWAMTQTTDDDLKAAAMLLKQFGNRARAGLTYG